MVKAEQEAAEKQLALEDAERRRKREEAKRRTRMLEAAFDGDIEEMKNILQEVRKNQLLHRGHRLITIDKLHSGL